MGATHLIDWHPPSSLYDEAKKNLRKGINFGFGFTHNSKVYILTESVNDQFGYTDASQTGFFLGVVEHYNGELEETIIKLNGFKLINFKIYPTKKDRDLAWKKYHHQ